MRISLFFLSLSLLTGCGRKLAPEPPLQVLPARVEPVRLSQEGSDVVLRFPYPSQTNAGGTLTNLTGMTVYRELIGVVWSHGPVLLWVQDVCLVGAEMVAWRWIRE